MVILRQQEEKVVVHQEEASKVVERCNASFLLDVAYSNPTKIDHYVRLLRVALSTSAKAAKRIQSCWKRYHHDKKQHRFIKESSASIEIQKIYRGYRIRKKQQQQKQTTPPPSPSSSPSLSSTSLSSSLDRKNHRRLSRHDAAVVIQRFYRRHIYREICAFMGVNMEDVPTFDDDNCQYGQQSTTATASNVPRLPNDAYNEKDSNTTSDNNDHLGVEEEEEEQNCKVRHNKDNNNMSSPSVSSSSLEDEVGHQRLSSSDATIISRFLIMAQKERAKYKDFRVSKFMKDLWNDAPKTGLICSTEEEAADMEATPDKGAILHPIIVLSIMCSPFDNEDVNKNEDDDSIDVDDVVLCHRYMHEFLFFVVERYRGRYTASDINMERRRKRAVSLLTPDVFKVILTVCRINLGSRNYSLFRGAVKVLTELGLLMRYPQSKVDYHNDDSIRSTVQCIMTKLKSFLLAVFLIPGGNKYDAFSTALTSNFRRISWKRHIACDSLVAINRLRSALSWEESLEIGYFKTVTSVFGAHYERTSLEMCRDYVLGSFTSWPVRDRRFQAAFRAFIQSLIGSKVESDKYWLDVYAFFIFHGAKKMSIPIYNGEDCYVYEAKDIEADRCFHFLYSLVLDLLLAFIDEDYFFHFLVDYCFEARDRRSFEKEISIGSKHYHGILSSQPALKPLVDYQMLSESLQPGSMEKTQMVALHVLRGLSVSDLEKYVSFDTYISAIRRFPQTLRRSWFHRREQTSDPRLIIPMAHCATSLDDVETLRLYAGDFSVLIEKSKGNTLLHTAAFHGSSSAMQFLLSKDLSTKIRNKQCDSPLDIARRRKHRKCIDMLISKNAKETPECNIDDLVSTIESSGSQSNTYISSPQSAKKKRPKKKTKKQSSGERFIDEARDQVPNNLVENKTEEKPDEEIPVEHFKKDIVLTIEKSVMKEVLSVHKREPSPSNLVQIVRTSTTDNSSLGEVYLEPISGTLDELITQSFATPDSASIATRIEWCRQLHQAVNDLHMIGVCHGSICPSYIYYTTDNDTHDVSLKLGLVAGKERFDFNSIRRYYPYPELTTVGDIFATGCVLSIILCGHHIYGLEENDQVDNITNRNLFNVELLQHVTYEGYDLVERMVTGTVTSIDECMSHPLFWNSKQRFRYISELVRTNKHMQLPTDERLGLGKDWRKSLRSGGILMRHLQQSPSSYSSKPSDFLRFCRNFYQHPLSPPTSPQNEEDKVGHKAGSRFDDDVDPLEEGAKELQMYQSMFPNLYAIFGSDQDF